MKVENEDAFESICCNKCKNSITILIILQIKNQDSRIYVNIISSESIGHIQ